MPSTINESESDDLSRYASTSFWAAELCQACALSGLSKASRMKRLGGDPSKLVILSGRMTNLAPNIGAACRAAKSTIGTRRRRHTRRRVEAEIAFEFGANRCHNLTARFRRAKHFFAAVPWTILPVKNRLLRYLRHLRSRRSTCVAGANWSICGPTIYTALRD
jgi:hypothetical protein